MTVILAWLDLCIKMSAEAWEPARLLSGVAIDQILIPQTVGLEIPVYGIFRLDHTVIFTAHYPLPNIKA